MLFRVTQLCESGIRRQRDAARADEGVTGRLDVDVFNVPNAFSRPTLRARIVERTCGLDRSLLPPLFDVVLRRVTKRGILLAGIQRADDRRQCMQEWWCEVVTLEVDTMPTGHHIERTP